jgi:hypothetical protein
LRGGALVGRLAGSAGSEHKGRERQTCNSCESAFHLSLTCHPKMISAGNMFPRTLAARDTLTRKHVTFSITMSSIYNKALCHLTKGWLLLLFLPVCHRKRKRRFNAPGHERRRGSRLFDYRLFVVMSGVGSLIAALIHLLWTSTVHTGIDFSIALSAFALLTLWKVQPWIVVASIAATSLVASLA